MNVKFLLCNSVYMLNTAINLSGYWSHNIDDDENDVIRRFVLSLYLTDVSNLLLVIQSATNWVLFYRFPYRNNGRLIQYWCYQLHKLACFV